MLVTSSQGTNNMDVFWTPVSQTTSDVSARGRCSKTTNQALINCFYRTLPDQSALKYSSYGSLKLGRCDRAGWVQCPAAIWRSTWCVANYIFCHSDTFFTSTANAAHGLRREFWKTRRSNTQQRESEREPRERFLFYLNKCERERAYVCICISGKLSKEKRREGGIGQ